MRIMPGRNIVLLVMSLLPVISHSQRNARSRCPMFSGESFHVSKSGEDDVNCGTPVKPCYSISYTVSLTVRQNSSSVLINISTGSYKEAESIKLDCGRWQLRRIAFWGARYDQWFVLYRSFIKLYLTCDNTSKKVFILNSLAGFVILVLITS